MMPFRHLSNTALSVGQKPNAWLTAPAHSADPGRSDEVARAVAVGGDPSKVRQEVVVGGLTAIVLLIAAAVAALTDRPELAVSLLVFAVASLVARGILAIQRGS